MHLILYCEIYKYTVKHTLSKATSVALLTVTPTGSHFLSTSVKKQPASLLNAL